MESTFFNVLTSFNEGILLVIGYMMYLFTDFAPEPETWFLLGKILLWLVYFDIAVNFIFMFIVIASRSLRWFKRFYIRIKHKIIVDYLKKQRV